MWGKDDSFGRWVQLCCGPASAALFVLDVLLWRSTHRLFMTRSEECLACGFLYLAVRCLWYAISGRDNINRDNF